MSLLSAKELLTWLDQDECSLLRYIFRDGSSSFLFLRPVSRQIEPVRYELATLAVLSGNLVLVQVDRKLGIVTELYVHRTYAKLVGRESPLVSEYALPLLNGSGFDGHRPENVMGEIRRSDPGVVR